jgi:hypothetical protein
MKAKANDVTSPRMPLPSEYMRKRRPHLFSDTLASVESRLTKEFLSYHLSTMTSRNGETTFEHFARKLAEAEICPNLVPNTGPTGGGDAKADTETYPVGKDVALRWYQGEQAAANERWAFAISAKKAWTGKVRSDVASIAGTKRDYKRIYFITNQPARSKTRADIEDDLSKKYDIPVRVLDLNWILEKVFDNRRLALAVKALGLSEYERQVPTPGPRDYERARDLQALDDQLSDASRYAGTPHLLAEDCLEGALTARGLGKPRVEVDGRFMQARRAAVVSGSKVLEFRVVYNWAWTVYFWFDDFLALSSLFGEALDLVAENEDADIVEKLSNLWSLLRMSVATEKVSPELARLDERGKALRSKLELIADIDARPNNALQAKSALLFVALVDRRHDNPELGFDDIWRSFMTLIEESRGLGTFPFEPVSDALTEFGDFIESSAYDELVEHVADALADRRREGESAVVNVQRAEQKLSHGKPYEAIRWFGRTIDGLVKKEYEYELFKTLAGLAQAYDLAGLPWAARSSAMSVVSHQLGHNLATNGSIAGVSAAMVNALFTFEIQIGRVPQAVSFHLLEMSIRAARARNDEEREAINKYRYSNAMRLGALILNTPAAARKELERLHDCLHHLDLTEAGFTTLFLLGQWDVLREEKWISPDTPPEKVETMIMEIKEQGETARVAPTALINAGERSALTCRVIGAELVFDAASKMTSITIAEALLGVIESFVATSLNARILPACERLVIRIDPNPAHVGPPTLAFVEEGGITVGRIVHEDNFGTASKASLIAFRTFCREVIAHIVSRMVIMHDEKHILTLEKENVFSRALLFSNVPMMTENIFSDHAPLRMADHDRPEFLTYPLLREQPWTAEAKVDGPVSPRFGNGEPPPGMFDEDAMTHRDYGVLSPIDILKWNAAGWNGSVFITAPPEYNMFPILGLAFSDKQSALAIFEGFHSRYGAVDAEEAIRVAIIRGISRKKPHSYAVSVGPNLNLRQGGPGTVIAYVARYNRMYPSNSANLDRFLTEYHRLGTAQLAPFHLPTFRDAPAPLGQEMTLKEIVVRQAWQIGENDPDISSLDQDADPYIPDGMADAPVVGAIGKLKKLRDKS